MENLALLACIIALAYATQAMIGFGANIIALTLGAHLMPLQTLLPVVVLLNLPHSVWLLAREHSHIHWGFLLRRVLPFAGLGFAIGLLASRHLQSGLLALAFGMTVVAMATMELLQALLARPTRRIGFWPAGGFISLAGLAQGLFASGGPFLAYAAARSGLSRRSFRISLIVVWFCTNSLLTANFVQLQRYDAATLKLCAGLLPVTLAGLVLGDLAHRHVPEKAFRLCVYLVLLLSGGALIWGQL